MGRRNRFHVPHAIYHVIIRGNNRQNIFIQEKDYLQFLVFLEDDLKKFNAKLHAYCLMSNHAHLAVEIDTLPLWKIMHIFAHHYAYWFNRSYKRVGHLFQGRYKAIMIQDEKYLLALSKYIHLNPLRANLVAYLEEYKWSSYLNYIDVSESSLVYREMVYSLLLQNKRGENASKIDEYKKFIFGIEKTNESKKFLEIDDAGKIICNDWVVQNMNREIEKTAKSKIELQIIIKIVCRHLSLQEEDLFVRTKNRQGSQARALVALCVEEVGTERISQLAALFGRNSATLCNALSRLKLKKSSNSKVASLVSNILADLKLSTPQV
ncbi:MAG: transposase [Gammaproteobacteria bacterium]